jgi:hypothetical protein
MLRIPMRSIHCRCVPRTRSQLAPLIDATVLEEALAGMSR